MVYDFTRSFPHATFHPIDARPATQGVEAAARASMPRIDIVADHPEVLGYLRDVLRSHEKANTGFVVRESDIDEELRKELKALRYLD